MSVVLSFVLIVLSCKIASCGEPVVYFPPFELRAVRPPANSNLPNMPTPVLQPVPDFNHNVVQVEEPHNPPIAPEPAHKTEDHHQDVSGNETVSVHNLLKALGLKDEEHKDQERVATSRDYEYPSYPAYPQAPEYGYPNQRYWPQSAPYYQDNPYAYVPPTYGHHSSPTKPFSLIQSPPKSSSESHSVDKPIVSKVAGKVSGIIGLVMALLTGSSPDDLELKGVKDLVINGIVKPLMLAKGGIKSLISKLSIPVIVLLLMNLEVLVLIWWLWEDCQPAPVPHHSPPPVYPYTRPTQSYGYNNYR